MPEHVLITGGAGFIGRRVAYALSQRGYRVRILDSLLEQVHGKQASAGVSSLGAELITGDIRDRDLVSSALEGVESVIHLAAEVGVGQSMYAIERYVSVNDLGTAVLFQALAERPVRRVVVASSMSIYGEGLYADVANKPVELTSRPKAPSSWDPLDPDGRPLIPIATPESKRPSLASVYALTKYSQECLTLTLAAAYGMEGVALRLFNVYGPGQALSNPYTGVLAIFASRLANRNPPLLFEDGLQRRDFVHVDDVAEAFALALERPNISGQAFNIGSGRERTVLEIAETLAEAMGVPEIGPEITRKMRVGDIRHCFADIGKAERELGYRPVRDFSKSLVPLVEWVAGQQADDRVAQASRELEARGLVA